jgi:5,10-methylenetetrahydromethanopterin reductase
MRIGIFSGDTSGSVTIDEVVSQARTVQEQGFASFWIPQIFGMDAITVAAVVGREVPEIELGTAVVPTYPRHPVMLAQQALTANQVTGGRFTLGIGLSHQMVIENVFGMSFDKPVRHMREHLAILRPLLHGEPAMVQGETLSAGIAVSIADAPPPPILVAALGPKMLELTGKVAEGTITWMTGPETLGGHTVPAIRAAAEAAGRDEPRVVAGVPICVTDDVGAGRERAAGVFQVYGMLPSYRAMLDREGLEGPADLAIVGPEDQCREQIARFEAAGITDLCAAEFGGTEDEQSRTRALLRSLLS